MDSLASNYSSKRHDAFLDVLGKHEPTTAKITASSGADEAAPGPPPATAMEREEGGGDGDDSGGASMKGRALPGDDEKEEEEKAAVSFPSTASPVVAEETAAEDMIASQERKGLSPPAGGQSQQGSLTSTSATQSRRSSRRLSLKRSMHDTSSFADLRQSINREGKHRTSEGTYRSSLMNYFLSDASTDDAASREQRGYNNGSSHKFSGSSMTDPYANDPYARVLHRAISFACADAFGILGADVWLHSEHDGGFDHAPGGLYVSPSHEPSSREAKLALERVCRPTRSDYCPPKRQIAGAGLAGYFWSQCGMHDRHCTWRDTWAIVNDPDQPPYPRMTALAQAGFGKATGVPFDVRGHRGVVLYFARADADEGQLGETANDMHLRVSADFIGAVSASSITADAAAEARRERTARTLRRVRAKLFAVLVFSDFMQRKMEEAAEALEEGRKPLPRKTREDMASEWAGSGNQRKDDDDAVANSLHKRVLSDIQGKMNRTYRRSVSTYLGSAIKSKAGMWIEKSKGGNVQPPPAMPFVQTLWTFTGAFLTMTTLSAMEESFRSAHRTSMPLGPFGALLTLQYGLTPAPASQPRNAIYGQFISLSVALLIGLFAPSGSWFRVPLTTGVAVATMCKMGIVHPPAGAAAVIFASNDRLDGVTLGLMLLGNLIAISMAILINNLNDKKQYPIYYAFVGKTTKSRIMTVLECLVPYLRLKRLEREERLDASARDSLMNVSMRMSMRKSIRR